MNWKKSVAWLEPFWVLAVAPILLLPGRFLPSGFEGVLVSWQLYALLILGVGWPIRRIAYGHFTRRTPLTIPIGLLLLWLPVNYWAAADKTLALDAVGYLLFGIALYFAFINWPPAEKRPQLIAWFILTMGFGLALTAPFLSNLGLSSLYRLPGISPYLKQLADMTPGNINENRMAGALVVILPLYVAVAFHKQQRFWLRLLWGSGALLILGLLILSQSRAALFAAVVGLAVLLILRWPRFLYLTPLVLLAAGIGLYQFDPDLLLASQNQNIVGGWDSRLELWSRGIYAITDFAFTGLGIGNFQRVIPILYPLFLVSPDTVVEHVHNLFLQVGLDLGFPGLIAYLALFINVFLFLWLILRTKERTLSWLLAAGVAAGLLSMFVQGIVDAPLWGSKPAFIPWLLVALAVQVGLAHVKENA